MSLVELAAALVRAHQEQQLDDTLVALKAIFQLKDLFDLPMMLQAINIFEVVAQLSSHAHREISLVARQLLQAAKSAVVRFKMVC